MQRILKTLDQFVSKLKSKGYDDAFLTASGFPGTLKESISKYLHDSLLGKEKGLADSFWLSTYVEWNGENKPRVTVDMKTAYHNGKFEVREMVVEHTDRYGQILNRKMLDGLSTHTLPDRKKAIAMVKEPAKQINTIRKRNKLW